MATRRVGEQKPPVTKRKAGTTPEAREIQLSNLAYDLVEKRILDGSASAQETMHFLKVGSSRERIEKEKLHHENELLKVRTEAVASAKRFEELAEAAIRAMTSYTGQEDPSQGQFDD